MTDDANQLLVPPSFVALYLAPGRSRPGVAREVIAQRHDFCEDLACMFAEKAKALQWDLGVTEADVLQRMHRGLLDGQAGLGAAEAGWVLGRIAEILGWPLAAR